MKTAFFNSYEGIFWPSQCHNFDSTAGTAAPAVNMKEEALVRIRYGKRVRKSSRVERGGGQLECR